MISRPVWFRFLEVPNVSSSPSPSKRRQGRRAYVTGAQRSLGVFLRVCRDLKLSPAESMALVVEFELQARKPWEGNFIDSAMSAALRRLAGKSIAHNWQGVKLSP